jgi:integrase
MPPKQKQRQTSPLTLAEIKSLQAEHDRKGKLPRRVADSTDNLYLLLKVKAQPVWQFYYQWQGKQVFRTLGRVDVLPRDKAKLLCDDLRKQVFEGIDPRKQAQKLPTFGEFWLKWIMKRSWSESEKMNVIYRLKKHAANINSLPLDSISPRHVTAILVPLLDAGQTKIANSVLDYTHQVFAYAVANDLLKISPIDKAKIRTAVSFPKKVEPKHYSRVENSADLAKVLQAFEGQKECVAAYALRILPHVVLRPSELLQAKKADIDLKNCVWTVPKEHMKLGKEHKVYFSTHCRTLLQALIAYAPHSDLLFPSPKIPTKPLKIGSLRQHLASLRIGIPQTLHGFRGCFLTLCKTHRIVQDALEIEALSFCLAHSVSSPERKLGYDSSTYVTERRAILERWSDFCVQLLSSSNPQAQV